MWPIVRLRQPKALAGPAYIQYYMNIWLSKKFIHVGSHTICQSLKKRLESIGRNTSMASWQEMNRGFTRMSPKVNSNRLFGCFKMSQIQQKWLAHEALPSQWLPVFFGKTGHVAIVSLKNAEQSIRKCTQPFVVQEIRKTKHRRRITYHHDNANSHTSAQTTEFLSTQKIDLMSHPPYSPDYL